MQDYVPSPYGFHTNLAGHPENALKMPWTIEQQLHSYALNPQRTERHEILWNSWQQDRRWLSQLLEYTVFSAPMYSRHNASHCESVLHNIECLLGEDEIRRLSATDCFAILLAVYIHDIGMVTTSSDRRKAIQSEDFRRFVNLLKESADPDMRWAAEVFLSPVPPETVPDDGEDGEYYNHSLEQYDIYRALVLLLAEYQRRQHANASASRVEQWIKDPRKLQTGLLMTGIPIRIFLQIAACARAHGETSFDKLLNTLPQYDDGFAQDSYHPMFIAVLLSLGDILDLDSDRFNPFVEDVMGEDLFPGQSRLHHLKHQAIRSLRITPKSIRLEADCKSPEELRQLCQEMDWLSGFLKNCSYHWASIAPDNFCGCLPVVELARVSLEGADIPASLVTTKFELSQKKAFRLLSGANLYERKFTFLREMLQNAIDAVKLQYWIDYSASEFGAKADLGLCDANVKQSLQKYPIHIDVAVKKRQKNTSNNPTDVTAEDFKLATRELLRSYEFGVEVKVQDCGIGISADDIKQISQVGSSHEFRLKRISKQPEWLRPTGHFGIGLQSLFLVDDHFQCITRTRTGECYRMTFHSGDRSEGYINIIPFPDRDSSYGDIPYGTCFSVFVPERMKTSHSEDMTGWLGMDPYSEEYPRRRALRRSIELMAQIEAEITELTGERLFPIITREQELDTSLKEEAALREKLRLRDRQQLTIDNHPVWQLISANTRLLERNEQDEKYCWLFQSTIQSLNRSEFAKLSDGSAYYFDVPHGRLYGWSQHAECFFCCGAGRILEFSQSDSKKDWEKTRREVRLFIKGLFVKKISLPENGLFEYIDIKNDSLQNYLQMSRDGLTAEGLKKLSEEIIPQIQTTFHLILKRLNDVNLDIMAGNQRACLKAFSEVCRQIPLYYVEKSKSGEQLSDLRSRPVDAVIFYNKFKSRLENISTPTDFSYYSLRPLPGDDTDILKNQEWDYFWTSICGKLNEESGKALKSAFENKIADHIEKDLTSRLLETVSHNINEILDKAKKQKNGTMSKTLSDTFRGRLTEVHRTVILCALCSFYANNDSPAKTNSCAGGTLPCSWEYLNREIACLLRNKAPKGADGFTNDFSKLWQDIFCIPCVEEKMVDKMKSDTTTIADIMLRNDRYAVFSSRSSHRGHWMHMLVHLSACTKLDGHASGKDQTVVDVLNLHPTEAAECRQREKILNDWHENIIRKLYTTYINQTGRAISGARPTDFEEWENRITRWIVRNLPTLSLGSDLNGNNRINVLTFHAPKQLFLDARMINLLTSRMQEVYEKYNAQRICTTTWDGLTSLCCKDNITSNILRVDRGKVSEENKKTTMLMAFPSELPEDIQLPNGESLGQVKIRTTYDLLALIRRLYTQTATEQSGSDTQTAEQFGLTYAINVLNCSQEIVKFLKLTLDADVRLLPEENKDEESELRQERIPLLDALQRGIEAERKELIEWAASQPEEEREQIEKSVNARVDYFLTDDMDELRSRLDSMYIGFFIDLQTEAVQKGNRDRHIETSWSMVDLPDDFERYMNSILIEIYGYDMETDLEGLKSRDLKVYSNPEEFRDDVWMVFKAAHYLLQYAEQQYQAEFLESICQWWIKHVSGKEDFIAYNKEHLDAPLERHELLELYKEQIRILIRAQIMPLQSPVTRIIEDIAPFKEILHTSM